MGRKRAAESPEPTFDSPLLRDVASALHRRRKAIAYRAGWSCDREFTESADRTVERLNLDLGGGDFRLSVWADGTMWLRLCVAAPGRNAGWAFLEQFHGSAEDVSAIALVAMVETTIAEPFDPGHSDPTGCSAAGASR